MSEKLYEGLFNAAADMAKLGHEHPMMLIGFDQNGIMQSAVGLAGDKDGIAKVIDKFVGEAPQMWTIAHISEAWAYFAEPGEEIDHDTPVKDRPGAFETVAFMFFREGAIWTASCKVDHKAHTLEKGELTKVKVGDIEGRFVPLHVR